jgi:hypothetical protein
VSTAWRATSLTASVDPFELAAEFANLYQSSDAQLPTPLTQRIFPQGRVTAQPGVADRDGGGLDLGNVVRADVVLFSLPVPTDQVVATIVLDFDTDEIVYTPGSRISDVLAACVDDRLLLDGRPVRDVVADLALLVQVAPAAIGAVPAERHTLGLVSGNGAPIPDDSVVAGLLYGRNVPLRPEFHSLRRPASLNRAEGEYAAVSRHASLLSGQSMEVQNSALLTTVQAVATSARFRQIWYDAQRNVQLFQNSQRTHATAGGTVNNIEGLADTLGNLAFDLAVNVEASADVGLGSSTAQIEDFQRDLYDVMRIPERSRTVGQTFTRLKSGLEAELIAIDSRVRARATVSVEAIASLLSIVGFPIFLVLAYLGMNASEVDQDASMFSLRYWPAYTCAGMLSLFAILLMFPRLRIRRRRR